MITKQNIFKRTEVDPNRGEGWVVDLSGTGNTVNPDAYWYFYSKRSAYRFASLVNDGMRPEEAAEIVAEASNAASIIGSIKSDLKAEAARNNGKKGGRPRKNENVA